MLDDSDSNSAISVNGLDDTFDAVTKIVETGKKTQLDEKKVKLKIDELQREMVELANSQNGEASYQRGVLNIIAISNKIFSKLIGDSKYFKIAFGLVLKSKLFTDSIVQEFGENLAKFFDLKSTVLLNLATCNLRIGDEESALSNLREAAKLCYRLNTFKFVTKNTLRNFVYLCTINSKAGNHSQAFQYSCSLQSMVENLLEVKQVVEDQPQRYIEVLVRAFRNFKVSSSSPGIGRVLGVALYFSGKSLIKLHSVQRSEVYSERLESLSSKFQDDAFLAMLVSKLKNLLNEDSLARQIPLAIEKLVIRQDINKSSKPRPGTAVQASRKGSKLNTNALRLRSRKPSLHMGTRASTVEVKKSETQIVEVKPQRMLSSGLKTKLLTDQSEADIGRRRGRRGTTADIPTRRRLPSGDSSEPSMTQRVRKPYSSMKPKGQQRTNRLMLVGDSNIEMIVSKANRALNLTTDHHSPWKNKTANQGHEGERPLFSGIANQTPQQTLTTQMRLTTTFLPNNMNGPSNLMSRLRITNTNIGTITEIDELIKPPLYRPLLVMADRGDFLLGMETANKQDDILKLKENRDEIDQRKFKEIKDKMLFQTINLKKKAMEVKTGREKSQDLRYIKKLIKEKKENKTTGKSDRWNYISFENSLPQNFEKFKTKKLNDLKKYLNAMHESGKSQTEIADGADFIEDHPRRQMTQVLETQQSISVADKESSEFLNDNIINNILKPFIQAKILTKSKPDILSSGMDKRSVTKPGSASYARLKKIDNRTDNQTVKRNGLDQKRPMSSVPGKPNFNANDKARTKVTLPVEEPIILSDRDEDISEHLSQIKTRQVPHQVPEGNQAQPITSQGAHGRRLSIMAEGKSRTDQVHLNVQQSPNNSYQISPKPSTSIIKMPSDSKTVRDADRAIARGNSMQMANDEQAGDSMEDLDINEIHEVEEYLERLRAFFLGYYRHKTGNLLMFLRDSETRKTVAIIKRLTSVSKTKENFSKQLIEEERQRLRKLKKEAGIQNVIDNFGEFKLNVAFDYSMTRNRPKVLHIKAILDDFIVFLIEVGDLLRAEMPIACSIAHGEDNEESDDMASPQKRPGSNWSIQQRSAEAYRYELPWKDLAERSKTFVRKSSEEHLPNPLQENQMSTPAILDGPVSLRLGLPLLKLGCSSSVSAVPQHNFFVTYTNPSTEKTLMVVNHYYEVENLMQSICHLLVDSSLVLHDIWPRLLLGYDRSAIERVRAIGRARTALLEEIASTRQNCLKLWTPIHLQPQASETLLDLRLQIDTYWDHLEVETQRRALPELPDDEKSHKNVALFSPMFSHRQSVPYLRISLLMTPFKVNNEIMVARFSIKGSTLSSFFGVGSTEFTSAYHLLTSTVIARLYIPKRQTQIELTADQVATLMQAVDEETLEEGLVSSFKRRFKPSVEAKNLVSGLLSKQIAVAGHKKVLLVSEIDEEEHKNIKRAAIKDQNRALMEPITYVVPTQETIQAFHQQIRKLETELRRQTVAVFLRHYNSIKRITGSERLYLTIMYGDYVELGGSQALSPEVILTLDFYSNDDQERLIKIERDLRSVEKLLNSMQMADVWMQSYTLQNSMSIKKTIMGRKVVVDKQLVIKEEMQAHSGDEYVKVLMLSKRIHKVVKEDIESSQVHLITSIENLGKCYATVEFITSLRSAKNEGMTLVTIDLSPVAFRLKLLKVILNHRDILSLFKANIGEMLNDRGRLLKLFQKIVSSLTFTRRLHYSVLSLPLASIDISANHHSSDLKEHFVNHFDKYALGTQQGIKCHPFMKRTPKESWILHKKVTKVSLLDQASTGEFMIFVVEKHIRLHCYALRIYFPSTCRNFQTTLYFNDMLSFSHSFSHGIFSISPLDYAHLLRLANSSYADFTLLAANHLKTQRYLVEKSNVEMVQSYLEDRVDLEEAVNAELARSLRRGKLVDRLSSKHFVQSHIWDKLLSEMKVKLAISKKYVVAVDNYHGAITELLSKLLFKSQNGQLFWIEIYIVKVAEPIDPFAPSLIIRYEDLYQYELLVKMKMIESQVTHNDKMSLQKVFDIYAATENIQIDSKGSETLLITQSKLNDIAHFVAHRIYKYSGNLSVSSDVDELLVENSLSRNYFFKDKYESKMKLNSRVNLAVRIEPAYRTFNPILLCTRVITLRPPQIVCILYQEDVERVRLVVHNNQSCEMFRRSYEMAFILKFVPHAKVLLAHNLLTDLGDAIFRAFKNSLLVELFFSHQPLTLPKKAN